MARKSLNFAVFDPMLWGGVVPSDPSAPVLEVQQLAPSGSPRAILKTRVFSRPTSPHDAFSAFNGRHDVVKRVQAYAPVDENGSETDALQEQIYVQPIEFHAYQLQTAPTNLYMTASDLTIKAVFRRYRETTGNYHATLSCRVVNIGDLEQRLSEMEIVGYTLRNVRSTTPITNYDVLGPQMDQNTEVQSAKSRAGDIAAITFELQSDQQILRVRVSQNGSVTFANYPGDAIALGVLDRLEAYIGNSSDTQSIQVRNGRGS